MILIVEIFFPQLETSCLFLIHICNMFAKHDGKKSVGKGKDQKNKVNKEINIYMAYDISYQ